MRGGKRTNKQTNIHPYIFQKKKYRWQPRKYLKTQLHFHLTTFNSQVKSTKNLIENRYKNKNDKVVLGKVALVWVLQPH